MEEEFVAVLRRKFGVSDVSNAKIEADYGSGQRSGSNASKKTIAREHIVGLFNHLALNGVGNKQVWAFCLESAEFNVATMFSRLDANICSIVPNWNAETITTNNETFERLGGNNPEFNGKNVVVLGAFSHKAIEFMCSIPSDHRPQFSFVWLDTCNFFGENQAHEIWNMFAYRLISTTGPVVFAATYASKRDGGNLKDDTENGFSRFQSLIMRITRCATIHHYIVLDSQYFENNGMTTVCCTVAYNHAASQTLQLIQHKAIQFLGLDDLRKFTEPEAIKTMTDAEFRVWANLEEPVEEPLVIDLTGDSDDLDSAIVSVSEPQYESPQQETDGSKTFIGLLRGFFNSSSPQQSESDKEEDEKVEEVEEEEEEEEEEVDDEEVAQEPQVKKRAVEQEQVDQSLPPSFDYTVGTTGTLHLAYVKCGGARIAKNKGGKISLPHGGEKPCLHCKKHSPN